MDVTGDAAWREALWRQFGAAIDMLDNAIAACPENVWSDRGARPQFWHLAFHALFYLDLYLSGALEGFAPPAAFTVSELDPGGALPERVYTKAEVRDYAGHCRAKARAVIQGLTAERAAASCRFDWLQMTFGELLFYTMRHTQHHAGQLNLLLRQRIDAAPRWVKAAS